MVALQVAPVTGVRDVIKVDKSHLPLGKLRFITIRPSSPLHRDMLSRKPEEAKIVQGDRLG